MNEQPKERGQVLIIIILAIVVIFGFAALAVDVGRLYAERRRAQNAADAAAYAAAFAASQSKNYRTAGITSVQLNGFNDADPVINTGTKVDVQIYNPPISGKYSVARPGIVPSQYYQVIIRSDVDKVFSQFVYNGPWFVQVEAVARSTAKKAFADGKTIVATCVKCCDGLVLTGGAYVRIREGDVLSNAPSDGSKGDCYSTERSGTNACLIVEKGMIKTGGTISYGPDNNCEYPKGTTITPAVSATGGIEEHTTDIWTPGTVPVPTCTDLVNRGKFESTVEGANIVLEPGIYPSGITVSGKNSKVVMKSGMYCLGKDFNMVSGSLLGEGVMIVMNPTSSVTINTTQGVTLSAPGSSTGCIKDPGLIEDDDYYCWSGFLFYMPYSNTGTISIAGGNSTSYTGTIYAPGPPKGTNTVKCKITGTSETMSVNGSIICYNVEVGGTGTVDIKYGGNQEPPIPASIELSK